MLEIDSMIKKYKVENVLENNKQVSTNIFEGLKKVDKKMIVDEIAMLEAVSMGSIMKGYGTTVANKGAKLINGVGKLLGKKPNVTEVQEKRIEDYIDEKRREIQYLDRATLDMKLLNIIKEKINIKESNPSLDTISIQMIESVAKEMKIEEDLIISQKADSIHRRYLEKILTGLQSNLKKQNSTEANKTANEIEENIKNLNESDREELKKVLNIQNLTGEEIRKVLMKAGTPALIIGGLSVTGFGAYMALTTIMHAVFTTILGVTLPFAVYTGATSTLSFVLGPAGLAIVAGTAVWQITKGNKKLKNEIMGQIIFAAVSACGGSFSIKNQDLPSYVKDEELLEKIKQKDEKYKEIVKENVNLKMKVQSIEWECKALTEKVYNAKVKIKEQKEKTARAEYKIVAMKKEKMSIDENLQKSSNRIRDLERQVSLKEDDAIEKELLEQKTLNNQYKIKLKQLNDNLIDQNLIIEDASKEIEIKERLIEDTEKENIKLKSENEQWLKEIQSKETKIQEVETKRKKDLEVKWNMQFIKFEFSSHSIRDAIKFAKREIWEIERALMELHELKDFKAISRGKIIDGGIEYEHMGLSLPCGFPTRILYRIVNNSNKKVVIEQIYKHNKKKYN